MRKLLIIIILFLALPAIGGEKKGIGQGKAKGKEPAAFQSVQVEAKGPGVSVVKVAVPDKQRLSGRARIDNRRAQALTK
jgi:hypothetical protein